MIAVGILLCLLNEIPSAVTRAQFAALPDFDYAEQVSRLRQEERFGEAIVIADHGLSTLEGSKAAELQTLRSEVIAERANWLRRAKEFGVGALIGNGQSVESMAGAVTADFFIVGDVRDLAIEGTRFVADGEADELILALSAVGVLTTLVPEVDWVAAVLKVVKKTGNMTEAFAKSVLKMCRRALDFGDSAGLRRLVDNMRGIAERLSLRGTVRMMKHVDNPADLAKVADFLKRKPDGALALHVAGREGVDVAINGSKAAQDALVTAAKKGDHGVAMFRRGRMRLLQPHVLVGVGKFVGKDRGEEVVRAFTRQYFDKHVWWWIVGVTAWCIGEMCLIYRRLFNTRLSVA